MEMTESPDGEPFAAPVAVARIVREHPGLSDYLALDRAVGEPLQWDQRLGMSHGALRHLLGDNATYVHVLRANDRAVGLCEFVGVGEAEVELTNFGLIPEFQGPILV